MILVLLSTFSKKHTISKYNQIEVVQSKLLILILDIHEIVLMMRNRSVLMKRNWEDGIGQW